MRIAFLSTFYPYRGGIAQFNALVYRELEKHHDVKAFTFTRQYPDLLFPGQTQMVTDEDNADVIDTTRVLDTINPFTFFKTIRAIKKFKPDVLIMKYWMSFFGPSLGYVARALKKDVKIITVLDNVIPHEKRFFDKACTSFFLKQNHGFIAMSEKVQKDLLSFQPNANCILKQHPLYNHFGDRLPVSEARAKLNIDKNKKTLLFFGFIRDYKGLDLLIDAFNKLDDTYQLVIAGEVYGSFDTYEKQIKSSPKNSDIHVFNQYIGDDEVPLYFSASDVCVLPYKSATQSGITSISYHFNLPIIATNVGGLKESIEHGRTGYIVDTPDSDAIADGLNDFFAFDQKELANNIAELKDELSWPNFAKSIESLIESC